MSQQPGLLKRRHARPETHVEYRHVCLIIRKPRPRLALRTQAAHIVACEKRLSQNLLIVRSDNRILIRLSGSRDKPYAEWVAASTNAETRRRSLVIKQKTRSVQIGAFNKPGQIGSCFGK